MKNHKTIVALLFTALFVLIQLPLVNTHELTAFEGKTWENAKFLNLDNLYSLNEDYPQPVLWQLLLSPLAKLGLPVLAMKIAALAAVALAVFLLIRFSKMHPGLKLVFIASSAFCYFNPIIATNYALLPLAAVLVSLAYEKRHDHVIRYSLGLALLAQTHLLISGLTLALVLAFIVEEIVGKNDLKKTIKNLALFIIPIAIAIAALLPNIILSFEHNNFLNGKAYENVAVEKQPNFVENVEASIFGLKTDFSVVLSIILLVILAIALLSTSLKLTFLGFAGFGVWFFILAVLYRSYITMPQKTSVLVLILFIILAAAQSEKIKPDNFISKILGHSEIVKFARLYFKSSLALIIVPLTLMTTPMTIASAINDYRHYDTNSAEVYNLINSFEKGSLVIIASPNAAGYFRYSVLAGIENDVEYYDIVLDRTETEESLFYAYKDSTRYDNTTSMKDEYVEEKLGAIKDEYDHIYYFTGRPSCNNASPYNYKVIEEKYKKLTTLGIAKYDNASPATIDVYKIK